MNPQAVLSRETGAKPVEEIDPVHQASAMVVAKDMTHLIGKNFVNIFT